MENQEQVSMLFGSGPVVQAVLIILVLTSIWSWAITISKIMQLRRAKADSKEFSSVFWESRNLARINEYCLKLKSSPLAIIFSAGYKELTHLVQNNQQNAPKKLSGDVEMELKILERTLKRAEFEESLRLQSGITFLATVASSAPFVGLFGTVWGIMNAFHGLSLAKTTSIQAVAPGISEALVATAIGLAAAIPAAVAYNYFATAIRNFRTTMDGFCLEFLNIAKKHFLS